MAVFGGMKQTTRGRNLQAKAQAGAQLQFTRIAVGDGELGSSIIDDLNALKNQVASFAITKLKALSGGKSTVGFVLSNQDLISGFYFREVGVFAQDPDVGEILYCYANAGATAEYIPAGGGPDVIEREFDCIAVYGNASNISAVIDENLIYATGAELNALSIEVAAKETPAGAQTKATTAETNAKAYADAIVAALVNSSPEALNTLNELATALGNDPNFATTVLNQIAAKADASALTTHTAETTILIPKAGSTANTILLDIVLTDKKKGSFKASAANTGNMTINGKAFKKDATTQIAVGGVKADKVYDFYYDLATDSVFILAKATGTAQPSQVLANIPFSNEDGEQIGTMPNRAGDTSALAFSISGTTIKLRASQGYRDGVDDNVTYTDANHIPANIAYGKTVLGVVGAMKFIAATAGDTLFIKLSTGSGLGQTVMTLKHEFTVGDYSGVFRIKFGLDDFDYYNVYAQIYKNGVAYGTLRQTSSRTTVWFTQDLSFAPGDKIQIWGYSQYSGSPGNLSSPQLLTANNLGSITL